MHKITVPISPSKPINTDAIAVPIAPPPLFISPSSYPFFTASWKSLFILIFPLENWNTLSIVAIHTRKIPYWINFEIRYSLSSVVIYIAIKNVPIGIIYFITPIIPPKIGLKCSPMYPDFVYINIASNILIKNINTTATFISSLLFLVLLPLFAKVISSFATQISIISIGIISHGQEKTNKFLKM